MLKAKMTGKIRRAGDAKVARRICLAGLIICSAGVITSLVYANVFEPEKVAKREFEKLAVNYYEKYFYPKFLEALDPERFDERMEFYGRVGVQNVPLRQVLLYNNGQNRGSEKYFVNSVYSCDKNETYAKFYPVEPYGVKDYKAEFVYKCKYLD